MVISAVPCCTLWHSGGNTIPTGNRHSVLHRGCSREARYTRCYTSTCMSSTTKTLPQIHVTEHAKKKKSTKREREAAETRTNKHHDEEKKETCQISLCNYYRYSRGGARFDLTKCTPKINKNLVYRRSHRRPALNTPGISIRVAKNVAPCHAK